MQQLQQHIHIGARYLRHVKCVELPVHKFPEARKRSGASNSSGELQTLQRSFKLFRRASNSSEELQTLQELQTLETL
jgi:hypothetical protein